MKTILTFLHILLCSVAFAQTFVEVPNINIEGVALGWVEFADIDGDNDPDLLIQGQGYHDGITHTKLFENDSLGNFTEVVNAPFKDIFLGGFAFADVDGDNDLDVLISGKTAWPNETESTTLYFNDGTGQFTESFNNSFIGLSHGKVAFADIDGDCDQDVLITGVNGSSYHTKLFKNDGLGNFSEQTNTPFVGLARASFSFADVDGDFDQDLLITGDTETYDVIAKLYLNDGSGNFMEQTNAPFIGVTSGSVAFADVDGDVDLDLLITGSSHFALLGESSLLYTNDGMGNFTIDTNNTFRAVGHSHVDFADIDGDSDQDVLITGGNPYPFSELYINDGLGHFTLSIQEQIHPVGICATAFADIDNDTDLDLFLIGFDA